MHTKNLVRPLAGALSILMLLPAVSPAQSHGHGTPSAWSGPPVSGRPLAHEDDHPGLHFSHPIFTESISPDRKVRFDFAGDFASDENEWETEFEGEWTFHRSFSIEVSLPYVFQDKEEGTSYNSLGNADVAFKFANFAFEDAGVLLGYGIGVGLPTGNEDEGIGSDHIWEFEPFLNAGYKDGGFEAVGWARFAIPTNQSEGEEVETDFHYDLSLLYAFHPRLQGLVELNGTTVASGEESGVGTAFAGPGVKFAPFAGVPLFVGVGAEFPLDADELDARGRVSLFYHF